MTGVPLACSSTLMRQKGRLVATNGMNADYLFHGDAEESIDLGDMTLQCGRRVDALKLWFSWQALGDEGFVRRIDDLFDLARGFRELLEGRPGYTLVREPQGTNVCFRYLPPGDRNTEGEQRDQCAHRATLRIRERLAQDGRFLVNYATLDGLATFRMVLNNSRTTMEDLAALLDAIEE
jgi:glutamate/tyrosine decarboxylase-like PLP-dependent enzyme